MASIEEVEDKAEETDVYAITRSSNNPLPNQDRRKTRAGPGQNSEGVDLPRALPKPPQTRQPPESKPSKPLPPPPPRALKPMISEAPQQDNGPSGPSFKYISQAENPELVKQVIERSLDATVPVSGREILALSLEARRHFKDMTQSRRIPAVTMFHESGEGIEDMEGVAVLQYAMPESRTFDRIYTAEHIDRLRTIQVKLNDQIQVTGVLDSGSEIIAMNKSVWKRLGSIQLSPDIKLTMESANNSKEKTVGLIENLELEIGGLKLVIQVHVLHSAPFDLLIGRPFFRFTGCLTQDFTDGSQELTLHCPNTGKVILVSTQEKEAQPPAEVFTHINSVGFTPLTGGQ